MTERLIPEGVIILRGNLGWGNRKGGLEAYGPGGRWDPPPEALQENARYGDLLGDALDRAGASEGADLIVIAVPRSMLYEGSVTDDIFARLVDAVTEQEKP